MITSYNRHAISTSLVEEEHIQHQAIFHQIFYAERLQLNLCGTPNPWHGPVIFGW